MSLVRQAIDAVSCSCLITASLQAGAYTTARTFAEATQVFDLSGHVLRLAESSRLMQAATGGGKDLGEAVACEKAWVDGALRESLRVGLGEWRRLHSSCSVPEAKVSVLLAWKSAQDTAAVLETAATVPTLEDAVVPGGGNAGLYVHVQELKPPSEHPIRVVVRVGPRPNAAAKDTKWVADRAPLEALMGPATGVEEVILAVADIAGTGLAEGTQTNFAVVRDDGAVQTAGEGVLMGTVRKLLLRACEVERVPVVETTPTLDGLLGWQGAVLSSTSRLVMPIDELRVPESLFRSSLREDIDADALIAAAATERTTDGAPKVRLDKGDIVRRFDVAVGTIATRLEERVRDMFAGMCESYE